MIHQLQQPPRLIMRIPKNPLPRHNRRRAHPRRLQLPHNLPSRPPPSPPLNHPIQPILIAPPSQHIPIPIIIRQPRHPHPLAQPPPLRVIRNRNRHPLIRPPAPIRPMRRINRMPIPPIRRLPPIHLIPQQMLPHRHNRRLQLRHIDKRALPRAPSPSQRRQNSPRRMRPANRIPKIHPRLHRRILPGIPIHSRNPPQLLLPDPILNKLPPRPAAPKRRHRHHHQIRPQLPQPLIPHPPPLHQPRPKILHHHIANAHQLLHHPLPLRMPHLRRNPVFTHMQRIKPPAPIPRIPPLLPIRQIPRPHNQPMRIPGLHRLHLNHLRPHIRQQLSSMRPRPNPRKIHHPHPHQRPRDIPVSHISQTSAL